MNVERTAALSGGVGDAAGSYDKQIDDWLRERYAAIEKKAQDMA